MKDFFEEGIKWCFLSPIGFTLLIVTIFAGMAFGYFVLYPLTN